MKTSINTTEHSYKANVLDEAVDIIDALYAQCNGDAMYEVMGQTAASVQVALTALRKAIQEDEVKP